MEDAMKNYLLQYTKDGKTVVDEFNHLDLALKARELVGGQLYHKRQVSEIHNGYLYLHANDTNPID
jgi:hypothetical protein